MNVIELHITLNQSQASGFMWFLISFMALLGAFELFKRVVKK